jgi:hypothetical protein
MEPHSGSRTTSSPPARQSSPRPRSSRSVRHQGLLRNQLTWGYASPDRTGRVFNEMWSWGRATVRLTGISRSSAGYTPVTVGRACGVAGDRGGAGPAHLGVPRAAQAVPRIAVAIALGLLPGLRRDLLRLIDSMRAARCSGRHIPLLWTPRRTRRPQSSCLSVDVCRSRGAGPHRLTNGTLPAPYRAGSACAARYAPRHRGGRPWGRMRHGVLRGGDRRVRVVHRDRVVRHAACRRRGETEDPLRIVLRAAGLFHRERRR